MKKKVLAVLCLIAILIISACKKDSEVINDNTITPASPTDIASQTPTYSPVPTQVDISDNITPSDQDNKDILNSADKNEFATSKHFKDANGTQIGTDLKDSKVDVEPTIVSEIDEETAVAMVRNRMKDLNDPRYYGDDTFVSVDHLDDNNNYIIQVYNSGQGMSETINWYSVDRISGQLIPMFDE